MTSSVSDPVAAKPRVDGARLLDRLEQLRAIGTTPAGGVTRLAYSPEDVRARDLVAGWLREIGLAPRVDVAGNLLARRPGSGGGGCLVTGSHLDTVVEAGHLDGAYGVVAAVEVAAALVAAGTALRHDLVVAGWSNEEGARGTPGMVGSRAVAGSLPAASLAQRDRGGVTLADRIDAAGGDARRLAEAVWPPGEMAALVELHVEQGPVLETYGEIIGVVESITGQLVGDLVLTGVANHAGSTPMELRRDALAAAAEVVLAVERVALDGHVRVATCGVLEAMPGVRNAIPGRVLVGVDVRDSDDARVRAAWERLVAAATGIGARRGIAVEAGVTSVVPGVRSAPALAAAIERAAAGRGLTSRRLPSGAGHDAQVLAALGPVAMIFVPSRGGVSHSRHEDSGADHLVAGAQVLLDALLALDVRVDA